MGTYRLRYKTFFFSNNSVKYNWLSNYILVAIAAKLSSVPHSSIILKKYFFSKNAMDMIYTVKEFFSNYFYIKKKQRDKKSVLVLPLTTGSYAGSNRTL